MIGQFFKSVSESGGCFGGGEGGSHLNVVTIVTDALLELTTYNN